MVWLKIIIIIFIVILLLIVNIQFYRYIYQKRNPINEQSSNSIYDINKKQRTKGMCWEILKFLYQSYMGWMDSFIRLILALVMHTPSHHFRKFILKYIFGMKIGKRVTIYYGAEIRAPWNIKIGEGTIIGDQAKLDGRNEILIGRNVNFSTGVWIWTAQHNVNAKDFGTEGACGNVIIEDRCWISCRTVVLPGTVIKEGAVVAAGAVVTKNCEAYGIYGGVPAKKIGERKRNLNYEFDGKHLHFL